LAKAPVVSDIIDEEATLEAKLKQLHVAEQALQKTKRVALLKTAIEEAEQWLAMPLWD